MTENSEKRLEMWRYQSNTHSNTLLDSLPLTIQMLPLIHVSVLEISTTATIQTGTQHFLSELYQCISQYVGLRVKQSKNKLG